MKSRKVQIIFFAVIAVLSIVIIASWANRHKGKTDQEVLAERETQSEVKKEPLIIREKEEINAKVIKDGLADMGLLETQEYYFTEVIDYSKVNSIWGFEIGITESSYIASYEGKILAGIDFEDINVVKDDGAKRVNISVPKAEIHTIDIDPDSFVLHSEKNGMFNPLSVEDFNKGLVELERTAEEKAIERGVLKNADANAESIIRNFVTSLLNDPEYEIVITRK